MTNTTMPVCHPLDEPRPPFYVLEEDWQYPRPWVIASDDGVVCPEPRCFRRRSDAIERARALNDFYLDAWRAGYVAGNGGEA